MNRRLIVVGIFLLVAVGGRALQYWRWYYQPFELKEYLKYIHENKLYVPAPPEILKFAEKESLLVNNPPAFDKGDLRRRIYLIDAGKLLANSRTPVRFKEFTSSRVYSGGAAFSCQQLFIVDGSILFREPREFFSRMSGMPVDWIKKDFEFSIQDVLAYVCYHEFAHIDHFDFSAGELQHEEVHRLWEEGTKAQTTEKYDIAVAKFAEIVQRCPADYKAINEQATAEMARGNNPRSIELFRQSLSLNSKNPVARNNIVHALLDTGRVDEAVKQIESNEQAEPNNPQTALARGLLWLRTGDLKASYREFTEARRRYLAAKDEKVIFMNVPRYGLAIFNEQIGVNPQLVFEEHRQDCKVVSPGTDLARYCEMEEPVFRTIALQMIEAMMSRTETR